MTASVLIRKLRLKMAERVHQILHDIISFFSTAIFLINLTICAVVCPSVVTGQQDLLVFNSVGVSLKLQGVPISNNSLVDIDDLFYRTSTDPDPTNVNGFHDQSLVCVTDLADCCESPRAVRGDWYYPDGNVVTYNSGFQNSKFQANRGPNEVINGRQFYGSVRLYRRWSSPPERGRFYCELPSAADPRVNQTLYVNILNIGRVTISASGSSTAGGSASLVCSASILTQSDTPSPHFQWFFGPNTSSLPTGLTSMATVLVGNTYYSSVLQFSPLNLSHAGMYTCRLGPGTLAAHIIFFVNVPDPQPVIVTSSSGPDNIAKNMSDVILICSVQMNQNVAVSELSMLMVNAKLIRPDRSVLNLSNPVISGTTFTYTTQLNSFGRSDSGNYTCIVTVRPQPTAIYLTGTVTRNNTVRISIGAVVQVKFTSHEDFMSNNFLLSCYSSGETVNSIFWTRNGFLLDSTGPLILTNASALSYTNVLMVSDRIPGTYTCTVRGPSDQTLGFASINVQASAPPVNVRATQSNFSGPVKMRWSPPPDGTNIITGYRIFYGNGQSLIVSFYYVSSIIILESPPSVGQPVSIQSESTQLPSKLITVMVTSEPRESCTSEVGLAIGVTIILVSVLVSLIIGIMLLCWWRKVLHEKKFAVSTNMAYGEINLEVENKQDGGGEYDDPDRLASKFGCGEGTYERTGCPSPYEFPVDNTEAPVYAIADVLEITTSGKTQPTII